jgi:hypothetical protein
MLSGGSDERLVRPWGGWTLFVPAVHLEPKGIGCSHRTPFRAAGHQRLAAPHNCHAVTRNTSVTAPLRTPPPATRTGLAPVQDRGESLCPPHFKYRALPSSVFSSISRPLPCLPLLSTHTTPPFSTAPKTSVTRSAPSGPHAQTRLRSRSSPPVSVEAIVRLHPRPRAHPCSPCFSSPLLCSRPERRLRPPGTPGPRSRIRWHRDRGWF